MSKNTLSILIGIPGFALIIVGAIYDKIAISLIGVAIFAVGYFLYGQVRGHGRSWYYLCFPLVILLFILTVARMHGLIEQRR